MYSIAAAAAGVSMLALAQPAKGEVVVTVKKIPIPTSYYDEAQHLVPIDLNGDGVTDFSFSLYEFAYHSFNIELTIEPKGNGAVVGRNQKGALYASALFQSAKIGPSAHFGARQRAEIEDAHGFDASSIYSRKLYGNWGGNPLDRYLGVRFIIDGATHYGWIRLAVITEPRGVSATITEYAYETVANKRILAGASEKSSAEFQPLDNVRSLNRVALGMLALGAGGLHLWRREETSTVN
jgi:hypothetical protein